MQTLRQLLFILVRLMAISLLGLSGIISAACSGRNSDTEPTPVISGPPNTTFPMPPISSSSLGELGWVVADNSQSTQHEQPRAKISDYQGSILVLDLYATWCAPCRESIPHLSDLHRRYAEKGLAIVGLNVGGADDRVKVAGFAREFGIPYQLGFPDKGLSDLLLSDNVTIPQTYVFDRDGKLLKRFIGYDSGTAVTLEQIIQSEIIEKR
jgi:thiol-disulfide isomerase/thioredoxin